MKTSFLDRVSPATLSSYILAVDEFVAALDSGDARRIAAARITRDAMREVMEEEYEAILAAV